ncbi:MAG: heavy metal translocating P-type ATPase [Gemmatimonadaceae bacterium]
MTRRFEALLPEQDANGGATAVSLDLRVGGMDCPSCAATIESALKQLDGVADVQVDVVGGRVRVDYAEGKIAVGDLSGAIRRVGYLVDDGGPRAGEVTAVSLWKRRGRLVMLVISGVALGLALLVGQLSAPRQIAIGLLALSTIAGGWYVVPRGLRAVMNRALDMNFLMSVAAGGAWIIGEQTEAAATLFLFAIAELLEVYSMDRARNAIKALMDLSPAEATVVRAGQEVRLPAADVEVGETVMVRPGEKIPVDGDVTSGRSSVNQAPITGESMPVDKEAGATVFAGSLNGHGALRVRSTKSATDTTLARIIHAVEEAQASRAPTQTFVDRFARIYTPAVVVVAIFIAVLPPLAGFGDWGTWVYRALAMLVVACPCALVISTPVSIVSGLAGAARAGILIKGGAHLEHAGAITTVCFDKTGTLTEGRPAVTDIVTLNGKTENDVLRLALGVERQSEHPIARAILEYGLARGVASPDSTDFEALIGRGARATVENEVAYVGNDRLAQELGIASAGASATLERFVMEGKTGVLVSTTRESIGVFAIADRVRPEARSALDSLRSAGIKRIVMLTGDNEGTGRAVAGQLGVDEYHAELLPDDKVRIVRELESRGERVAFVGDGVNDAPALAAATVGVAMGAAGTDVALETADIALMGDDLRKLALAMRLSRKTLHVIKQNVWFSIVVKAVFLLLAVSGWATLWMAVAADMGASLLVVMNGLRALRAGCT